MYLINTIPFPSRVLYPSVNDDDTNRKEDGMLGKALHDDLNTLHQRNQLLNLPSGGAKIISSPSLPPITIPDQLRNIPVNQWRDEDRIWLNM